MSDDLTSTYLQRREAGSTEAMLAELDAFVATAPTDTAAPAAPAAPVDDGESTASKVGKDVAKGTTEIPRAMAHGAIDAANEVADMVTSFAGWVTEKAGLDSLPGLRISGDGVEVISAAELEKNRLSDQRLPNVDAPTSVTGNLVEGVAQFVAGFGALGKALGATKAATAAGKAGSAAARGAVTDFSVFDPQEARLSNLIESNPELSNPITSFLAADPNDSEAEGRFKNAVEGLGLGVAADGLVQGLRIMRKVRDARIEANKVPEIETATPDFGLLGDTKAEDFFVPEKAPEDPGAAKLKAGEKATEETTSDEVLGTKPIEDEIKQNKWVVDGRSLWELTTEDIRNVLDKEDEASISLLVDAFGNEADARRFMLDSESFEDAPYSRARKMFDALPSDKQSRVDAWWEGSFSRYIPKTVSAADLREMVKRVEEIRNFDGSAPELAEILKYAVVNLGEAADPGKMSTSQMTAFLELREGMKIAAEKGWDKSVLSAKIISAVANQVGNREDAKLLLQRFLNPEKTKPALPGAKAEPKPEPKIFINWARINSEDDVKTVMQNMADMHATDVDKARRGVRSWETTKLSAGQKDAWKALANRRSGDPLNAETAVAARQLWATSGAKLKEVAEAAASAPSEANLVMFRKMLATHYAIQREVIAARTETARALNSWAIPAGEGKAAAKQLEALLEANGGVDVSQDLAKRVAALANADMMDELERVVEAGVWAKTKDAVAQVWVNGLLTNPATHLVNSMSNWSVAALSVGERRVAGHLSRLMGAENGVEMGEAAYMTFGLVQGIKEALRISAKGRKVMAAAGRSLMAGDMKGAKQTLANNADEFGSVYRSAATGKAGQGMGKLDAKTSGGSLSSEAWGVASDTWLGRGLDVLDTATSAPGRALTVSDEFFKTIGYRMELNARALRQATQEVRDGVTKQADLKKRIAEILENPPEDIKLAAIDTATYNTFTSKPATVPKRLADGIQQVPILGRLILPFKNTPINVMTFAFERTPFAPLIAEWRADIAAGGARGDLAMARTATGTLTMLAAMDLALSGVITGAAPKDSGKKQQFNRMGKQAYSVKVGNKWYSYSRADPVGMTLGLAADMVDIATNGDLAEEDMSKALNMAVLSIAKNVTSKTYMEGVSNFFDAVSDPDRYGDTWFQKVAGSFVPSGVAAVARMEDPYMRLAADEIDAIKRRTPGLSDDLPKFRDLWGRPVDYRSGEGAMYDLFSPVYIKRENPEPIDTELSRLGYYPGMPKKKFSYQGVDIDLKNHLDAYSRYVELAGNEAKDLAFGMGAKDFLNAVVSGTHPLSPVYQMMDDEKKENFIEGKLTDYRKLAREQVMREFPALQVDYERKRKAAAIGLP